MLPPGAAPVIDGHLDVLDAMERAGRDFFTESAVGQVALPRLRRGGVAAAFCAIRFDLEGLTDGGLLRMLTLTDRLRRIVEQSRGAVRLVRSMVDLEVALAPSGPFGAIMHLEGAGAIDADLAVLRLLHAVGLRSLGLVWRRPNRFAQGAGAADRGEGLTPAGVRLVRECRRLGILIDVSHLNDAGFWDVIRLADGPVVATHANARALAPHPRNLTDAMIRAIAATGGLVGLTFHVAFVRPDLRRDAGTPLTLLAEHLDHIAGLAGVEHVALGSGYDGCLPPAAIGDVGKLPALLALLAERGWRPAELACLCRENYWRVLSAVWGNYLDVS